MAGSEGEGSPGCANVNSGQMATAAAIKPTEVEKRSTRFGHGCDVGEVEMCGNGEVRRVNMGGSNDPDWGFLTLYRP